MARPFGVQGWPIPLFCSCGVFSTAGDLNVSKLLFLLVTLLAWITTKGRAVKIQYKSFVLPLKRRSFRGPEPQGKWEGECSSPWKPSDDPPSLSSRRSFVLPHGSRALVLLLLLLRTDSRPLPARDETAGITFPQSLAFLKLGHRGLLLQGRPCLPLGTPPERP